MTYRIFTIIEGGNKSPKVRKRMVGRNRRVKAIVASVPWGRPPSGDAA